MNDGTKTPADSGAVPLQSAVLCVDCESVSDGRYGECLVCGSRSLHSVSRIVGGTLLAHKAHPEDDENPVLFDLKITIDLQQIEPKDLSATVDGIASLVGPRLRQGHACCHIDVEPVGRWCDADTASPAYTHDSPGASARIPN